MKTHDDGSISFELRMRGVPEVPMSRSFYYCRVGAPAGVNIADGAWFARVPCVGEMVFCACQNGDGTAARFRVTGVTLNAFQKLRHARSGISFAAVLHVEPI